MLRRTQEISPVVTSSSIIQEIDRHHDSSTEGISNRDMISIMGVLRNTLKGRGRLDIVPAGALGINSVHGVFFADNVAVKRFQAPEKAARELSSIDEAKRRGLWTLTPVEKGLYDTPAGTVLVTELEEGIATMDRVGWQDVSSSHEEYGQICEVLRSIAEYTARLHAAGMAHGDFQLKNIGQTPKGFVTFDLERARFLQENAPLGDQWSRDRGEYFVNTNSTITFERLCFKDVGKLLCDLAEKGFLQFVAEEVFKQEIYRLFIEPYWDAINEADMGVYQHPSIDTFYTRMEEILNEAVEKRKRSEYSPQQHALALSA